MSKTAILIDDDRDDLELLEEAIRQVDHSVKCVSYLFCDDALRKIFNELSSCAKLHLYRYKYAQIEWK